MGTFSFFITLQNMNFLDILLAIPLCYFIYKGWRRGLVFEIVSLVSILLGAWACVHFSTWVADALNLKGEGSVLIAFFITFAAVVVLAYFFGKAIEGVFKMVKLNALNKILGAVFGMIKCLCVLSVIINFIMLADHDELVLTPKVKQESVLFTPTHNVGNKLTAKLHDYVVEKRRENAHRNVTDQKEK